VWIHGDCKKGNLPAHTCPKCGNQEWEKWMVAVGNLPRHAPVAQGAPLMVIPLYEAITVFAAVIILVVLMIELVKLWKITKIPMPPA
jgi:hypothetical protein